DQIQQLSKTVYVTNFPNHIRAQDLWNVCKDYGSVVDVYIPFKKSQVGKRFAFIRFIKVVNLDRLIDNLCTIWFGSFHLHATIARFQRESKPTFYAEHNRANIRKKTFVEVSHKNSANTAPGSYAFAVKKGPLNSIKENEMKPALVLDDSCYQDRDFSLSLLGKVKEFSSLSNLKMVLDTEGFTDITIKYMGGLWVLISFQSIKAKENFLSHVGAGSWFSSLQQPSDSFHTDERIAWIDIEGVPIMAWSSNTFTKITSKWGDLLYEDDKEDSCFHRKRVCIKTKMVENIFESFKILVKGKVYWTRVKEVTGWNPDFMDEDDTQTESDNATIQSESDEERIPKLWENTMSREDVVSNKPNHKPKEDGKVFACSGHFQKATTPRSQGSELVKVGHTMGYKMDGCIKNIEEIIEFQRVNEVNR
ncbi:nucleotide-binding alpha-beta plait domain-containing protein, partial [Tanacetum coccineum]